MKVAQGRAGCVLCPGLTHHLGGVGVQGRGLQHLHLESSGGLLQRVSEFLINRIFPKGMLV